MDAVTMKSLRASVSDEALKELAPGPDGAGIAVGALEQALADANTFVADRAVGMTVDGAQARKAVVALALWNVGFITRRKDPRRDKKRAAEYEQAMAWINGLGSAPRRKRKPAVTTDDASPAGPPADDESDKGKEA